MPLIRNDLPLSEPQLPYLAKWLLAHARGESPLGLADTLVLLPATRACATLQHALLEASGDEALVLPEITTPLRLAAQAADRFGLADVQLPSSELRPLLLARRLTDTPWLRATPEAASSLAEDLVSLFDDARLYRLDEQLLDQADLEPLLALDVPDAAELLLNDLDKVREAWRLYRRAVPRDDIDLLVEVAGATERDGWPGPSPSLVVMAGFAELPPVVASFVRGVVGDADAHLFQPSTDDPLSRLLLATYRDPTAPTYPLRPASRVAARLATAGGTESTSGDETNTHNTDSHSADSHSADNHTTDNYNTDTHLYERLAHLGDAVDLLGPDGPVTLVQCNDPEHESREVVRRVVEHLTAAGPARRVCIATADRDLAARVVERLRDAGIDTDDTGGQPLASRPAGILVRTILRTVVTGLMFDQLLELLTHPYVDLQTAGGGHTRWTLRLEKRIRANQAAVAGRQALLQLAREYDRVYDDRSAAAGMEVFAAQITAALDPLWRLRGGHRHDWRDYLSSLREVWTNLAPEHPLTTDPAGDEQTGDLSALARLLDELTAQADRPGVLPEVSLSEFTGDFARLLGARTVRKHRSAFLPVQVMGLLEARLERFDLLILAGLREEVLPGRRRRPVVLSDRFRCGLGLPTWREHDARDAELLLRLLHNGDEVVVTWPTEAAGRPVLPSPQVARLLLVRDEPPLSPGDDIVYQKDPADRQKIAVAQAAFIGEQPEIPGYAARPVPHLSHSALTSFVDCPYRFLLERGYDLKEEEQILRVFQSRDFGSLVHDCLAKWLKPDGMSWQALARGDAAEAADALVSIADEKFGHGSAEIPVRRLWEVGFARACGALAVWEVERFKRWRPLLLEVNFKLSLGQLRDWLTEEDGRQGTEMPAPVLDTAAAAFLLRGKIDHIDAAVGGATTASTPPVLAVIDYKTSAVPTLKSVRAGEELQVALYALAVEAGVVEGLDPPPNSTRRRVAEGAYYKVAEDAAGFGTPQLDLGTADDRAVLLAAARVILAGSLAARRHQGPFPLVPSFTAGSAQSRFPCRYCALRSTCRIEERIDAEGTVIDPATAAALRKMLAAQKES